MNTPEAGGAPQPLITAQDAYPALERIVDGARDEVLMSFRIFDPDTALRDSALIKRGLSTWAELIEEVAGRGVRVRILLADFDPAFVPELHRDAWRNTHRFAKALEAAGANGASAVLCAPHGQRAGGLWHYLMRGRVARALDALRREPEDRLTDIQKRILRRRPMLRPATIHQKFAVVDGARLIVGGIDVNERRWDEPDHDRPAEETWHDVAVQVDGPVAGAFRRHFSDCWQDAEICADGPLPAPVPALDDLLSADVGTASSAPETYAKAGDGTAWLVRTRSLPCTGFARLGPDPRFSEHEETLNEAFGKARRHIYIETQFFRHLPLAHALAKAARAAPDLQVVLLMPTAPERVIFGGDDGFDARHALALQLRCIDTLRAALGDRLAIVSPAKPKRAEPGENGTLGGAGIVYVHAKVTCIDDAWALVGSANLNGRSLRWDTEASLAFTDAGAVRTLRTALAGKWLGDLPGDLDTTRATTWTTIAGQNADAHPDARENYVMPFPEAANRRFARYLPILPAEMF